LESGNLPRNFESIRTSTIKVDKKKRVPEKSLLVNATDITIDTPIRPSSPGEVTVVAAVPDTDSVGRDITTDTLSTPIRF
jgi:hypothetical protein